MAIIRLCKRDPLVEALHELLGYQIVRIPETRIQPLSALVHHAGRTFFRGALAPLLVGDQPLPLPVYSSVPDIAGRRSLAVGADLGLHILRGLLRGFGLPSAEIAAKLARSESIAFAFPGVRRAAVDINQLGRALNGRMIDRSNPAAAIFFNGRGHELLIVDSILVSNNVKLLISSNASRDHQLDVTGIEQLLAAAGARITVTSEGPQIGLLLEGKVELTFAFTCVRVFFDKNGVITSLPPDLRTHTLREADEQARVRYSPDRVVLHAQPGMLVWDSAEQHVAA